MLSLRSVSSHSNHVNAHAKDATIIITSIRKHSYSRTQVLLILNGRLCNLPCQPGIYLPRKMNIEPDLSLVRDKFSVRYEC